MDADPASAPPPGTPNTRLGAYGLRLLGLDSADRLLVRAPKSWPSLEIVRRVGRGSVQQPFVGDERADVIIEPGADLVVDRSKRRAVFTTPRRLGDDELIHPYLAPIPAVASRWFGREAFHAGAFVLDGGVWGLIGAREAGKSTTLAWLALHGHDVFADDVLVLEGTTALAGPRSVDLRTESAEHLGAGEPLGVIGSRERWRLILEPVEPELPLRGWIYLDRSEEVEIISMSGPQRLRRLPAHRALVRAPDNPEVLLELAALPGWELRRPLGWNSFSETIARMLDVLTR